MNTCLRQGFCEEGTTSKMCAFQSFFSEPCDPHTYLENKAIKLAQCVGPVSRIAIKTGSVQAGSDQAGSTSIVNVTVCDMGQKWTGSVRKLQSCCNITHLGLLAYNGIAQRASIVTIWH